VLERVVPRKETRGVSQTRRMRRKRTKASPKFIGRRAAPARSGEKKKRERPGSEIISRRTSRLEQ